METTECDRCGGNGLIAVEGNAPAGTGRCPACHGYGRVEQLPQPEHLPDAAPAEAEHGIPDTSSPAPDVE